MFSIYWITTSLISILLIFSAGSYLFSESVIEGIRALGFPDYFRIQLAYLKLIAAVVLFIPAIPLIIKDWAYVGVGLFLITAFIAHYEHKDPLALNLVNIIVFAVLVLSRVLYSQTV